MDKTIQNVEDTISRQKDALVHLIKECEKKEKDRLKRLTIAKTTKEHKQLLERFTKERKTDQERIECLSNDFRSLQQKFKNGELKELQDERSQYSGRNSTTSHNDKDLQHNRFVGLEDRDGEVSYDSLCIVQSRNSLILLSIDLLC